MVEELTYFARRRDDVVVEESFDLVRLDLPQQTLDLQFNLPLAVDADGDDDRAEQQQPENTGDDHRDDVTVVLGAVLVEEATLRLILGN